MSSGINFILIGLLFSRGEFLQAKLPEPTSEAKPSKSTKEQTKPIVSPPAKPQTKISPEQQCTKIHERFVAPLQALWSRRDSSLKAENTSGLHLIENFPKESCLNESTRKSLLDLTASILNQHTGKIGVIVPKNAKSYFRLMISGMEARITANKLDPKNVLLVLEQTSESTEALIAKMIYEYRVTALIGGSEETDAAILRDWSSKLLIPTFLLTEPHTGSPVHPVFYAHPTQQSLAKVASEANIRYGHRRVAILAPNDQHSEKFLNLYESSAKTLNIQVVGRFNYDPNRYESMESAAKKLFRLDPSDRKDELKALYESAKKHAKDTGTPFNPKTVALQPDIHMDAVLIPDNFKIVRHFAKIMSYLGVRRIPLFGHYEWRSSGLITPWDSFLAGSYFVDFQGLYTSIPDPLKAQLGNLSPYFLPNNKVEQADFSLVGWKAVEAPLLLISKTNEPRRKLDGFVPRKISSNDGVYFDPQNSIAWTPFTYVINSNGTNAGQIIQVK